MLDCGVDSSSSCCSRIVCVQVWTSSPVLSGRPHGYGLTQAARGDDTNMQALM